MPNPTAKICLYMIFKEVNGEQRSVKLTWERRMYDTNQNHSAARRNENRLNTVILDAERHVHDINYSTWKNILQAISRRNLDRLKRFVREAVDEGRMAFQGRTGKLEVRLFLV